MDYEAFQSCVQVKDCELAFELLSTLVTEPELCLGRKFILLLEERQKPLMEHLDLK